MTLSHVRNSLLKVFENTNFGGFFKNSTKRFLHANIWKGTNEFPENSLKSLQKKKSIGVAFSGGGTRSASATLGQLAALDEIGLMKDIKYISAVSGGSWATIPYVFLPSDISDENFFGHFDRSPQDVTMHKLNQVAQRSLAEAISDTVIIDDIIMERGKLSGDETFSRAIGNLFLEKFGLHELKRSFTFDDETLESADKSIKYYKARDNRPFFIAGANLLTEEFGKVPIEYTAYYTGIRPHFKSERRSIGGHYISSYAYDSSYAKNTEFSENSSCIKTEVSNDERFFTLSDVAGSSGAAPQEILNKLGWDFIGFPKFCHCGLKANEQTFEKSKEIPHADGGLLENFGVMPLFARQIERIFVFINTRQPLVFKENSSSVPLIRAASSLQALFQAVHSSQSDENFATNVVIEGGYEEYLKIIKGLFRKKQQGQSLIHTDTYHIMKNGHFGINIPYEARITWVYNDRVPQFEKQLPYEVSSRIGKKEFSRFPHYRTFLENIPKIIDLSVAQVNLLSHLSYWNISHNSKMFLD